MKIPLCRLPLVIPQAFEHGMTFKIALQSTMKNDYDW